MTTHSCPICGQTLIQSTKDSEVFLCYNCRKKFKSHSLHKAKINEPKIDEPEIDEPEIDEPEIDEPEIDEPEIDEPEINEPEIDEQNSPVYCPHCGIPNESSAKFCAYCGHDLIIGTPDIHSVVQNINDTALEKAEIDNSYEENTIRTIICSKCGYENKDNSRFCEYCNKKLGEEDNIKTRTISHRIVCSKCGYENKEGNRFCEYCNTSLIKETTFMSSETKTNNEESKTNNIPLTNTNENTTSAQKVEYQKLAGTLKILTIVFIIIGIIMLWTSFHKILVYYSSEYYPELNKNAYVGGDAYNYIINGTYFAGYSILAVGSFIISTITGITSKILKIKSL